MFLLANINANVVICIPLLNLQVTNVLEFCLGLGGNSFLECLKLFGGGWPRCRSMLCEWAVIILHYFIPPATWLVQMFASMLLAQRIFSIGLIF